MALTAANLVKPLTNEDQTLNGLKYLNDQQRAQYVANEQIKAAEEKAEREKNNGGFWGGLGYTFEKLGLGFMSAIEGMVDFTVGGIADLFGAHDWAEQQFANDWVNYNHADEWFNPSDGWKTAGDIAGGIGTSIPAIIALAAVSYATGGAATPAMLTTFGTSFLSAGGQAVKEAYNQTGELGAKEWGYGALVGATEGAVETFSDMVLGGVGGQVRKAFQKDVVASATRKTVGKQLVGAFLSEGFEEVVGNFAEPYWKRMTIDPNADNATLKELAYAGFVGGMSGLIMSGGQIGVSKVHSTVKGNNLASSGQTNTVIQQAEILAERERTNQSGIEIYDELQQKLNDLKSSLATTGGEIQTIKQKTMLGELQQLNVAAVFTEPVIQSAQAITDNPEAFVKRYAELGNSLNGKSVEQVIAELKTVDKSSKRAYNRSLTKLLKKNDLLRGIAIADAVGKMYIDAERYGRAAILGNEIGSQIDLERFIENPSAEKKAAVGEAFGISDWSTITHADFIGKMTDFIYDGKLEAAYKAQKSANEISAQAAAIDESAAKKLTARVNVKVGETVRLKRGNADIAVVHEQNGAYRVYNYETQQLSKPLSKQKLNEVLAALDKYQTAVESEQQGSTESGMSEDAQKLDSIAREHIKEYKKLNADGQTLVRETLRRAKAAGATDETACMYARFSARSGVAFDFVDAETLKTTDKDGKESYADAAYDLNTGKILVNKAKIDDPKARTASKIILHEFTHALVQSNWRVVDVKMGDNGELLVAHDNEVLKEFNKLAVKALPAAEIAAIQERYASNEGVDFGEYLDGKYKFESVEAESRFNNMLADELAAHFAEKTLGNAYAIERLLGEKPTFKERVLSFLKNRVSANTEDAKLTRAAKTLLKRYTKLFNEFSAQNTAADMVARSKGKKAGESDDEKRLALDYGDIFGHKAVMKNARIDSLIEYSGATNPNYARMWITSINPTDFIDLTTERAHQNRETFDKSATGDHGGVMSDYDYDAALTDSDDYHNTPRLEIDVNTGEIRFFDGRHRMRALERRGVTSAEIYVEFYDDGIDKHYNQQDGILKTVELMRVVNARGTGQYAYLHNIIPLNENHRAEIFKSYGEESIKQRSLYTKGDIRYALPEVEQEAVKEFGHTYKWSEAGYILTDGSRLDFSGAREGASGGYRSMDHREISRLSMYSDTDGTDAMIDFMQRGNIRLIPEINGVNIAKKPTSSQESALGDYISRVRGEITLDIDDSSGNTVVSMEYPKGTYFKRILQDINKYFDSGEKPQAPSSLSQFRYALSATDSQGRKLTAEQYKYFKDSKVRDEKGRLLTVYHGTTAEFNTFTRGDIGFHFGTYKQAKNRIYGAKGKHRTIKAYLNITNPLVIDTDFGAWSGDYAAKMLIEREVFEGRDDINARLLEISKMRNKNPSTALREYLRELGYDGVKYLNLFESEYADEKYSYIAFDSSQIKLVENTKPTRSADIRYALSESDQKIGLDMSDEQRYEILKNKVLSLSAATKTEKLETALRKIKATGGNINMSGVSLNTKRKLLSKIAAEFGAFKEYRNADVDLTFDFSNNNLRESVNKQQRNYELYAKMLTCFDEVVENAVGIEAHNKNNAGYKNDPNLRQVYVLASAFVDGENIVPVKLEVKEFSDRKNTLHVAIAMQSIKMDEVIMQRTSDNGVAKDTRSSNISIVDLMRKVNTADESFTKYFPKQVFDKRYALSRDDSSAAPRAAYTKGQLAKLIANNTKKKVYTKTDAEQVITGIVDSLVYDDKIGSLSGKSRAEVVDYLFQKLNSTNEGYRGAVARQIADFVIDNAVLTDMYDEYDYAREEAFERLTFLRQYMHKLDLTSIQDEIEYKFGKHNAINLLWGKKGGMTPDMIVDELAESAGIQIRAENNAEIFFELLDEYNSARNTVNRRVEQVKLSAYGGESGLAEIRQKIVREVMTAYETRGEKTKYAKQVEVFTDRISKLRKELSERTKQANLEIRIYEGISSLQKYRKGEYLDSSFLADPKLDAFAQAITQINSRNGILKRGLNVRQAVAVLDSFYRADILNADNVEYYEQSIRDDIDMIVANLNNADTRTTPLSIAELQAVNRIVQHIGHLYREYNTVFWNGRRAETRSLAGGYINGIAGVKTLKSSATILRNMLNPYDRLMEMQGFAESGVFADMYENIQNAATQKYVYMRAAAAMFDDFTRRHKGYQKSLRQDMGNGLTKGQMLSLLLTYQRQQGNDYLSIAGAKIQVANEKYAKRGQFQKAIDYATDMTFDTSLISQELTDADKEFIGIVQNYFQWSGAQISAAELDRYGFANAKEDNYFPISVSGDEIFLTIGDSKRTAFSITRPSFTHALQKVAKNGKKLFIGNIVDIVNSQIAQASTFCGYANTFYSIAKLWNVKTESGEQLRARAREIDGAFPAWFDRYLSDVQGVNQNVETSDIIFGKARSWAARAALGLNPKVWFNQLTSIPMAKAVGVGFGNQAKGFFKTLVGGKKAFQQAFNEMIENAPEVWQRYQGSIAIKDALGLQAQSKFDEIMDYTTAPIQFFDKVAITSLWNACKAQNGGNMAKTAEQFKSVLRLTQPNYEAINKSQIMRSKSQLTKTMTMYMTQPLQNFSRLYASFNKLRAMKQSGNKTAITAARKEFGATLAAFLVQTAMFVGVAQLFKWLLGKERKDKDGNELNVGLDVLRDFGGAVFGMFPLVRDAYSYFTEGFEPDNVVTSSFTTILSSVTELVDGVSGLINGDGDTTKVHGSWRKFIVGLSQTFGIPLRNLERYTIGLTGKFNPSAAYKYNSFFYNQKFTTDIQNALKSGDTELANSIMSIMLDEQKAGDVNASTRARIVELYEKGYDVIPKSASSKLTVNGETIALNSEQRKRFKAEYAKATPQVEKLAASLSFARLSDEQQAKAIRAVYDVYYDKAVNAVVGTEKGGKLSNISAFIGIDKAAVISVKLSDITGEQINGKTVNNSRKRRVIAYLKSQQLSDAQVLLFLIAQGYKIQDGDYKNMSSSAAYKLLLRYISSSTTATPAEKAYFYELCGYTVKNGKLTPIQQ